MFTPEAFLNQTVEGAMSTRPESVPVGTYTALISELKPRAQTANGAFPCDVTYSIDDPELREKLGRDKITVRQNVWLDFKDDGATLDNGKGKNTGLGKLREAAGQNDPSKPWAPSMLVGQAVRIQVEESTGKDGEIYSNVTRVSKL